MKIIPVFCSLFLVSFLSAADINVTLVGVTPTQAVVSYSATGSGACSFALSESADMAPLVHDADPVLFPASNSDARAGGVSNGAARTLVLGKRAVEKGADGRYYSRALQAYTRHFLSVTCGSDTGKLMFRTQNPPLGNTYPEVPLFDPDSFGNYAQPTIDFKNQDTAYIDPLTGIELKLATMPGSDATDASVYGQKFQEVVDSAAAWTSPASALSDTDSATYNGAGGASTAIFLMVPYRTGGLSGLETPFSLMDWRLYLTGSGSASSPDDRTLSACLSTDHGQTCAGKVVDLPALPKSAGQIAFPATNFPSTMLSQWTTPLAAPVTFPMATARSGTILATGTDITLQSGDAFLGMVAGDTIFFAGGGCPNDECTIASVPDEIHLKITTAVPGSVTTLYAARNFGVRVWKKSGSGSVSIHGARYDWVNDAAFGMPELGAQGHCSSVPAVTTVSRNGAPLSGPLKGYLCTQENYEWGIVRLFWHGSNGEVRHIASLVRPEVKAPEADSVRFSNYVCPPSAGIAQLGNFSDTDANSLYCTGNTTGSASYDVIYKCTYNAADPTWGNYREWTSNLDFYGENPAESCVNITKASEGKDIKSQIKALAPGFDRSRYQIGSGSSSGHYLALTARVGQDTMGYYVRFNTLTDKIDFIHDSWSQLPLRWGAMHGGASQITPNYGGIYIVPMAYPNQAGRGAYQFQVLGVDGLPSSALPSQYRDARTCEQLGVTSPAFIADGATGRECVVVTTDGEPYNSAPADFDLAAFPDPHNAAKCGGDGSTARCWTKLQDLIEGDYIRAAGTSEDFRIVKKISSTRLVLQREADINVCEVAFSRDQPAGWIGVMWPRNACWAIYYFFDADGNTLSDIPVMDGSHNDVLNDQKTDNASWVESSYLVRNGSMGVQAGKPQDYSLNGSPLFAGSKAAVVWGIQSHPSARQTAAAPADFRWILDGRPYGGADGGSNLLLTNTITPTGIADVYKVSKPRNSYGSEISSLDRKRLPLHVWAGHYLLDDKSGPKSALLAGDRWKYCVADFAGECIPGSAAGDVYMNVPQLSTIAGGICYTYPNANTPCWVSATATTPFITQVGIDHADPNGTNWRRISNFFNGLGYIRGFWNGRSLPDASWMFTETRMLNGVYSGLMTAKLPPWPAEDGIRRDNFIPVSLTVNGDASKTYRARFGYDPGLFCTTRKEQCATIAGGSDPFQRVSENKAWKTCSGACQITIPAISGRVLYYVVDAKDATGNVVSTGLNVYPVP